MSKPISELAKDYRKIAVALEDPDPQAVDERLREWQGDIVIGQEQRLGPSLKQAGAEHVFAMDGTDISFGTSVPYAAAHLKWREMNGETNFLRPPDEVVHDVLEKIVEDAIVDGMDIKGR